MRSMCCGPSRSMALDYTVLHSTFLHYKILHHTTQVRQHDALDVLRTFSPKEAQRERVGMLGAFIAGLNRRQPSMKAPPNRPSRPSWRRGAALRTPKRSPGMFEASCGASKPSLGRPRNVDFRSFNQARPSRPSSSLWGSTRRHRRAPPTVWGDFVGKVLTRLARL